MKKIFRHKKKFLSSFLFLFLLSGIFFKARALPQPGWIQDCKSKADCVEQYGGVESEWLCQSNVCVTTIKYPVQKLQEDLENSYKNGSMDDRIFTANIFNNILGVMTTGAAGKVTGDENSQTGQNHGLIGIFAHLSSSMIENPPASGIEYFADLGKNLGFVKSVYAQTTAFDSLKGILPLWKAMRNIAYILFIVVFLFIGLSIMFRLKISPQAAVTIQNALPKIVIALILVTFSYAIAGLMIDLINVIIYLGIAAFGPVLQAERPAIDVATKQREFVHMNFADIWWTLFSNGFLAINKAIMNAYFTGSAANIAWKALGGIIGMIVGFVFSCLFSLVALFLTIKLFFSLLTTYITIVVLVILAPLQISLGAFPNSKGGFGPWFNNLMANILVFPAVVLTLFLGYLLTKMGNIRLAWTPPTMFFSGSSGNMIAPVIGFAILVLVTKVPEMVKNAFKVKDAGYGTAIGQALKPATEPFQKTWGATKGAVGSVVKDTAGAYWAPFQQQINEAARKASGVEEPESRPVSPEIMQQTPGR